MPVFCPDDVVARRSKEDFLGVVERTHGDVDTHDPYPGRTEQDRIKCDKDIRKPAFNRFMKDGIPPKDTVLVRWQHSIHAQLIQESKLEVIDRSLLIGDIVKKNVRDAMSGVVIKTFTKCDLLPLSDVTIHENGQHSNPAKLKGLPPASGISPNFDKISLTHSKPIKNVPVSELTLSAEQPSTDDLVLYKGWIGRVEDVTIFVTLRLSDNCVVELKDDLLEQLDGSYEIFNVGDIASTKKGALRTGRWIYGNYNPNTMPVGTVVRTRIVAAEISWLERRIGGNSNEVEPNSTLERDEFESSDFTVYDRTRRPHPVAAGETPPTVSDSEEDVRLNLRVRFKDLSGACVKYDGSNGNGKVTRIDRRDNLGYDLNVYDVVKFQTEVTIQWQDLSITHERSVDLVPEMGIDDEHDAWPGEIAHLVELEAVPGLPGVKQARKVGVVQSVNASERMAKIKWCPDACVQYSEDTLDIPQSRDVVTGVVGFAAGEPEEVSLYDVEAPGELNVRRGDIVLISDPTWRAEGSVSGARNNDWVGEIVDTPLDGALTVRIGAANPVRDVSFRREHVVVAIRSDRTDEIGEWDEEDFPNVRINSDGDVEFVDESNAESDEEEEGDSSEYSFVSESDERDVRYENEDGEPMDAEDVQNEDWESDNGDDENDIEMRDEAEVTPPTSQSATPPDISTTLAEVDDCAGAGDDTSPSEPEQYLVLDGRPPTDHAFSTRSSTEIATQIKRTQKEHRILRTACNLPKGVYVRTWESRLDLLRVLFVGPEGTPYVNAPFIIDFYLPALFPSEPPQAFFHSWTAGGGLGGVGRVNPNLYEDGKICLSLLGTWESGKGSEGWNAGRSTLLQVIVSLLGLVLVREPYFNEAGYEHLAGLETSKRASLLYSERVFLKARTFVLAALLPLDSTSADAVRGLEGLEDVLAWLYRAAHGPRLLQKNIADVETVLRRSEGGGEGPDDHGDDALPLVSKGACISLRKILEQLRSR